jgi:4-diphosphocytidyl-2-C-methyl-D-erythritol kinase
MKIEQEVAPAKLNLYLHVTGRRADGYHLLDSLVGFAGIGDRLEAEMADNLSVRIAGPNGHMLLPEDNSVLKAANALRAYASKGAGAAITLHKHLPIASGVGGGSSDAAAALRLLMRLWDITLTEDILGAMALALGADVPVCLSCLPTYMGGIGEHLEQGPPLDGMHVVLVNPGLPLRTADVFAAYDTPFSAPVTHPAGFASLEACVAFLRQVRNDLELPAIKLMPEIAVVLGALARQKDCLLARMSGSGATCFGLFKNEAAAQTAARALGREYSAWWIQPTELEVKNGKEK